MKGPQPGLYRLLHASPQPRLVPGCAPLTRPKGSSALSRPGAGTVGARLVSTAEGLQDDFNRARAERAAAEAAERKWADSSFGRTSPKVVAAPASWRSLVKEALPLLRFDTGAVVGDDPEGVTRVRKPGNRAVSRKTFLRGTIVDTFPERPTHQVSIVTVRDKVGKDGYFCGILIVEDGRVAGTIMSSYGDFGQNYPVSEYAPEEVNAALVRKLT